MKKDLPAELEELAPEWYKYLARNADYSKLKNAPNENLDINHFKYCIIGEAHGKSMWYVINKKCKTCFDMSYEISQEYARLHESNGTSINSFNKTLQKFINHFKAIHKNK